MLMQNRSILLFYSGLTFVYTLTCYSNTQKKLVEFNASPLGISAIPQNAPLYAVADSPQQKPATNDCGIIILYIIQETFLQQQMIIEEAEEGVVDMRRTIVEAFLHCKL
ncbi:hypothetical protein ACP275_08G212600 [Erythranthe tilingii]